MRLGILTLNIANPSTARAERQLPWLAQRPEQVLVLTETGPGPGTRLLLNRFAGAGWEVRAATTEDRERGVAIVSRLRARPRAGDVVPLLPARAELVGLGEIDVLGLYVPSRDESMEKIKRKRGFLQAVDDALGAALPDRNTVVIGDLNVLEPAHYPRHGAFRDWEYGFYEQMGRRGFADAFRLCHPEAIEHSWVDYENRGYRFDHAFVSAALEAQVAGCGYVHATREDDLSDHSALSLLIDVADAPDELDDVGSPEQDPGALF
jgi:exodeoxyribonuclease-3